MLSLLLLIPILGSIIFIVSFILNFTLFVSINLGLFGGSIKDKFINYLNENIFLFYTLPFIVCFVVLNYLTFNTILLDNNIQVIVDTEDAEFVFSGDFFKVILNNLGAAAVFSSSARIAAGITAKMGGNLSLLPKFGIIGSASTGFTATYLLLTQAIPVQPVAGAVTGKIKIGYKIMDNDSATAKAFESAADQSKIMQWFSDQGLLKINKVSKFTSQNSPNSQDFIVQMSTADKSRVIEELNKTEPTWKDKFINCPLEKGDLLNSPFMQVINDIITTNLVLHFVILYLLIMLVMIFSCKVILDNNINFDKILNYPLGKYIHRFITFYVNIWKNTANFWIYFILFCLIFFNCGIVISLYKILSAIH